MGLGLRQSCDCPASQVEKVAVGLFHMPDFLCLVTLSASLCSGTGSRADSGGSHGRGPGGAPQQGRERGGATVLSLVTICAS